MHVPLAFLQEEMDLLSQHKFSRLDIRRLEGQLLQVLDWQLNPVTSFTAARDFIEVLEWSENKELVDKTMALLCEAVKEYAFVPFKGSVLGVAAVSFVRGSTSISDGHRLALAKVLGTLGVSPTEVAACYRKLVEIYPTIVHSRCHDTTVASPTSSDDYDGGFVIGDDDEALLEELLREMCDAESTECESQTKRARIGSW